MAVALLVASTSAACGPSFRKADTPAGEVAGETAEVGSGVDRPGRDLGDLATTTTTARLPAATTATGGSPDATATSAVPAGVETGRAELVIKDPRGPGRSGVTVLLEGPVTQRLRSGTGGRLEAMAPPGRYRIAVETGCTDDLHVTRGASGELGLATGDVARGELTVAATLRYRPENGAYWKEGETRGSGRADWRRGEVHIVEVSLADPCSGPQSPFGATGAPLGRLGFDPGEGLEVVGAPPKTIGADGRIQVRLRCVGPDVDVALDLVDTEIPSDRMAVFSGSVLAEQSTPFCTAP